MGFKTRARFEDDIGLVEICHQLGVRFMQLTYNNQSLMATGCYEAEDTGLTRFGQQAVSEMNRVGLVIDMSHSADRSMQEAIDAQRAAGCWGFRFIRIISRMGRPARWRVSAR